MPKLKIPKVPRKWLKFQFGGGGGYEGGRVPTENTQSAKKWLNFNFRGRGGILCQVKVKTQSAKICLNFNFGGGGGGGGWGALF